MQILPGKPYPLGSTWQGDGTNFALFSQHATRVELCLFESAISTKESNCIPLQMKTNHVWHGFLPEIKHGQHYGYRVYGEYSPQNGYRFNPHKVLLDPYAKAIGRNVRWSDAMFGYKLGDPAGDLSFDHRDNAADCPLGVVIDNSFRWGSDKPLRTPWNKSLIYELHVKGMTYQHPGIPSNLLGTYAGLASKPIIQHLQGLGVTAIELIPVHHKVDDRFLVNKGLTNYWGYNTLNYFAPETSYAFATDPQEVIREFKRMVKRFHQAGIEVLLDVVYNHTAEGNELGPTLSFRGIDNHNYYRLVPGNQRYYRDYTGCGNSLNNQSPFTLQLLMDSLRYWVQEMHIDGFRFDLTSTLGREGHDYDRGAAFFDMIHQDPVLSQVKLIAEPWDVGDGGYQLGNYPVHWSEWNGKYRDCVRSFWRGDGGMLSEFATRLTGSSDLYLISGRGTRASINFVTSHDGFSLQDLVSYQHKHNDANGEENRDGDNSNHSWNCGVEGVSSDPKILALREKQKRNFMATLLLSQGVAMLRSGDEFSHTQRGNNNAYCQDNPINWLDWELNSTQQDFLHFVKKVVKLWRENPVFQKTQFFQGTQLHNQDELDITWLTPQGKEMTMAEWGSSHARCVGVRLAGDMPDELDEKGQPISAKTFVLLFNARADAVKFILPDLEENQFWRPEIDTSGKFPESRWLEGKYGYPLDSHSLAILRLKTVRSKIATKLIGWLKPVDQSRSIDPSRNTEQSGLSDEKNSEQLQAENTLPPTTPSTHTKSGLTEIIEAHSSITTSSQQVSDTKPEPALELSPPSEQRPLN